MQIKTIMIPFLKFYFSSIRLAKLRKHNITPSLRGCGETELIYCWWECQLVGLWQKGILQLLTNLHTHLLFDLSISLLRIHLKMDLQQCKNTYTRLFITALFVTAKYWKQPKWPNIGNMVHPHNGVPHNCDRKNTWPSLWTDVISKI